MTPSVFFWGKDIYLRKFSSSLQLFILNEWIVTWSFVVTTFWQLCWKLLINGFLKVLDLEKRGTQSWTLDILDANSEREKNVSKKLSIKKSPQQIFQVTDTSHDINTRQVLGSLKKQKKNICCFFPLMIFKLLYSVVVIFKE